MNVSGSDGATTVALSIVIPCYNEGDNLDALVARCRAMAANRADLEVVLIDNGSRDDTARRLAALLAGDALFRVVTIPVNIGYGHGVMSGLLAARGQTLAWTHADLQTDVADVLSAYDRWRTAPSPSNTIVRGRRVGRPLLDVFFTNGMSLAASLALGEALHDINAQPKLFPRGFLSLMQTPPDDFSLDLYALYVARRAGWAVLEVPVRYGTRVAGIAKGGASWRGKWKLVKRTAAYIIKLRARERARRG